MLDLVFGGITHLAISKRGLACCQADGPFQSASSWRGVEAQLPPEISSAELVNQLSTSLRDLLMSQHAIPRKTTITLADSLVRYFMVAPPTNTGSVQDCRDAANARFSLLYDEPTTDWELRGHWHPRKPFLVCALPKTLLNQILSVAEEFNLLVTDVAPFLVAVWNTLYRRLSVEQWLVIHHEDTLSIAYIFQHGVQNIRILHVPSEAQLQADWLNETLTQCAMHFDVETPKHIHLVGRETELWRADLTAPVTVHRNKQSRKLPESISPLISLALWGRQ